MNEREQILEKIKKDLEIVKRNSGMIVKWVDRKGKIYTAMCLGLSEYNGYLLKPQVIMQSYPPSLDNGSVPLDEIFDLTICVPMRDLKMPLSQ